MDDQTKRNGVDHKEVITPSFLGTRNAKNNKDPIINRA